MSDITDIEWLGEEVPIEKIKYFDGYLVDSDGRKIANLAWGTETSDFTPEVDDKHGAKIAAACQLHGQLVSALEWMVNQLQGDSGTGHSYWEQFSQYRRALIALDECRKLNTNGGL